MIFEMFGPLNPATTQDSIHPNYLVASELKDPICHSDECQIGSFSSEATICEVVYAKDMGQLSIWYITEFEHIFIDMDLSIHCSIHCTVMIHYQIIYSLYSLPDTDVP